MQNYLVTGGAGFIGSNLVEHLLQRGKRVRVLDNLATGRLQNLAHLRADIEFVEADIRDLPMLRLAVAGMDVVLHQAALPSVPRSVKDPLTSNEVNVTGTLNVLVAARDADVRRVVVASSSSVYGNTPTLPKIETMPTAPLSPYAVSKLATETYCASFTNVYGLPTIALRYFNVFGPNQDPNSFYAAVIPKFITLMMEGQQPVINGDGLQSRDFTYVENVVQANMLAAEAPAQISGAFNVACGERYSLLSLVGHLNTILGTAITPHHVEAARGDVRASLASIEAISQQLGYKPTISFSEGLRRTVAHLNQIALSRFVLPQPEQLPALSYS